MCQEMLPDDVIEIFFFVSKYLFGGFLGSGDTQAEFKAKKLSVKVF